MRDPYDSLGLEAGADIAEIRSAYRRLAGQFHPDRFSGASPTEQRAALERMQEINQAFAVLTDPTERRRYERHQRLRQRRRTTPQREAQEPGTRAQGEAPKSRAWRADPRPADLEIREFSGWGGEHWVFVHAPGGRAGKMNVATGEVTIEREELRDQVLTLLRHFAFDTW